MSKKIIITAAIVAGTAVVATIAYNTGLVVQHNRDGLALKETVTDLFEAFAFLKDKSPAN